MFVRDKKRSIQEILITEDNIFSTWIDPEKIIFADYCYAHSDEFKLCIEALLKSYYNDDFAELDHFVDQYNQVEKQLNELLETQQNISKRPLSYQSILVGSPAISQGIQNLIEEGKLLGSFLANSGLVNIQQRLIFCINLLIDIPYVRDKENSNLELEKKHTETVLLLADFWFHEGHKLLEDPTVLLANKRSALYALALFFISGSIDISIQEKISYLKILAELGRRFTWEGSLAWLDFKVFSVERPRQFIKLYEYLFNEKHEFSEIIKDHKEKNPHVRLRCALFELYVSSAYHAISDLESSVKARKNAKHHLSVCLNERIPLAVTLVQDQFPFIDTNLDIYTELAIYFLLHDNLDKGYELSCHLHQNKKIFDPDYFSERQLVLYRCWIVKSSPDWNPALKKSAIDMLQWYSQKNHVLAISIIDNLFLKEDPDTEEGLDDLLLAADMGVHAAKEKITFFFVNSAYHKTIKKMLSQKLEQNSLTAFQILKDYYVQKKFFSRAVGRWLLRNKNTHHQDYLNGVFDRVLASIGEIGSKLIYEDLLFCSRFLESSNEEEKKEQIISTLKDNFEGDRPLVFNIIKKHAENNLSSAVFLATFFLFYSSILEFRATCLCELKDLFDSKYENKNSAEVFFIRYQLEKHVVNHLRIDWLLFACHENYVQAIREAALLLKKRASEYDFSLLVSEFIFLAERKSEYQFECNEALAFYYLNTKDIPKTEKYMRACYGLDKTQFKKSFFVSAILDVSDQFGEELKSLFRNYNAIENFSLFSRSTPSVLNSSERMTAKEQREPHSRQSPSPSLGL